MHVPLTPVGPLTLVSATHGQIAARLGASVGSTRGRSGQRLPLTAGAHLRPGGSTGCRRQRAGMARWAIAASCRAPLVARACPLQHPGRPSSPVKDPPASVTTGTRAAMS